MSGLFEEVVKILDSAAFTNELPMNPEKVSGFWVEES